MIPPRWIHTIVLPGCTSVLLLVLWCGDRSQQTTKTVRFVTGGDIHYQMPEYAVADYYVEPAARELQALDIVPEFYLHTGDFFHAGRGTDIDAEADHAFQHFASTIGMPFYISIGNHDKRGPYERNALPLFSKQLGRAITTSYFSFTAGNCHFLILDCMQQDFRDQLAWAEADLKRAQSDPAIDHIFSASHYPLWIVARSGFTNAEFTEPVARLLAQYGVDAHFCGHTHNKTATVRLIDGRPLTQVMDASVVEENRLFNLAPFLHRLWPAPTDPYRPGLLPLEEGHRIFIPNHELQYYWGYQEGSTSSYNVVTVQGEKVTVEWRVLGSGVQRAYEWTTPGIITNTLEPAPMSSRTVTDEDLGRIRQAWLYVAPWTKVEEVHAPFTINGIAAGECLMTRKAVAYSPFWNMVEIPVRAEAVASLRNSNTVMFSNPAAEEFGLAHVFLLAQLDDGRMMRTGIAPKVYASFDMTDQESFFPALELIQSAPKGRTLAPIDLSFEKIYVP